MTQIGYTLSSEEHGPNDLVKFARRAEEAGFAFAFISDHFHPWIPKQGQSPFAWSVLGGVAQATQRLGLGTGVTCPTIRYHPAIIAQAAATIATMAPGRFALSLGSGENLNEHILGDRWPEAAVRLDMLEEAVRVIRTLWQGGLQSHHGRYYRVEDARIFTLPDQLPPILIASSGQHSAELAGRIGDGLVSTSPKRQQVQTFEQAGGKGKPRYGQLTVCWAADEETAVRNAHEIWPNSGLPGALHAELKIPDYFAQAAQLVTPQAISKQIVCGPDAQRHIQAIQQFVDAGFDHVFVHQVGRDQEGFFRFYQQQVLPTFA